MTFFQNLRTSQGTKLNYNEEVKIEDKQWFNAQTGHFYLNDISRLIKRWQKYIILVGQKNHLI